MAASRESLADTTMFPHFIHVVDGELEYRSVTLRSSRLSLEKLKTIVL